MLFQRSSLFCAIIAVLGVTAGCQPETQQPFAEGKSLVCPARTQRVEITESSYPEYYCVGLDGKTGPWLEYDVNGSLRKRLQYDHDKLNGPWQSFHPDGKLETKGQMVDDNRTGVWIQYYINGNLRSEKTYQNNQLDGPLKLYYNTGKLMAEGAYKAGVEDGPWKVYTPDGRLARECMLVNGEEKDCIIHIKDFQITTRMYESKERGPL